MGVCHGAFTRCSISSARPSIGSRSCARLSRSRSVTVDHQTLEDRTVTLRDRDSLEQTRIAIDDLGDELERRLEADWHSPKLD